MVLVPFVHIHGTVEVGIHEERIVSQRAAYTQVVTHAVAFDIGFVDDVDTIFVTEFVETFLLDLEDIRDKALALGMVPVEEVPSRTITVTRSQPKPERTLWDDIVWFFGGLFGDGEAASFG